MADTLPEREQASVRPVPTEDSAPVAIVTGASSGIGWATSLALGKVGYRLGLTARRPDRLDRLALEVSGGLDDATGSALALPADITDRSAIRDVADACLHRWGRIDLLVNNAGVMPLSALAKVRVDDWERTIDVNVKGVLYAIAAVLPTLLVQRRGHIVNISSLAGRRPFPNGVIYSATKFAVRAISQGLRAELSSTSGIRITDIEPGVVDTELIYGVADEDARERFYAYWRDHRPLDPSDVADAVLYAVRTPPHVNVNEILLRPTDQKT